MAHVVLLGPQRFQPTVASVLDSLRVESAVGVVTAGWQEREAEDQELRDHCARDVINLELYRRAVEVTSADAELGEAVRRRQDELHRLQQLYRLRLSYMLEAARRLMEREGDGAFLLEHRRAAIRAVRTLDRQHVQRVRKVHAEFDRLWQPSERPAVAGHRDEIRELLGRCAVLAIAGGHVTVLLNRLRLFDVLSLAADRPLVAWSAGAMALAERVVLFHDHPPQGAGDAEVLEAGLGAFRGLVPLPHARERLDLDSPVRVALLARRFSPAICIALEEGTRLEGEGKLWNASEGTLRLGRRGNLMKMVRP